jgi:putative flippase GtrA
MLKFVKYAFFGSLGATVDMTMYVILIYLHFHALIANSLSTLVGISTSYLLNSRITFNRDRYVAKEAFGFVSVGLLGLLFSNLIIGLLLNFELLSSINAKILTLPLVAVLQFLINKNLTFKTQNL